MRLAIIAVWCMGVMGLDAIGSHALAQTPPAPKTCETALSALKSAHDGAVDPQGTGEMRFKPAGGYRATGDAAAFAVDGYREHAAVRLACSPENWPASVTPEGLAATIKQGVKAAPERFCGAYKVEGVYPAPHLIRKWTANAGVEGFADRVLEIQGKLTPKQGTDGQSAVQHLADAQWLHEVSEQSADACRAAGKPDLEPSISMTAASNAQNFAQDNVNFLACLKTRQGDFNGAVATYDEAAKAGDAVALQDAYSKLEVAARAISPACASSKEGTMENAYVVAAKRIKMLVRDNPDCLAAVKRMSDQRQAMNTASKTSIGSYAQSLQAYGKSAADACRDPAPQVWSDFVAWVSLENLKRLPAK